MYLITTIEQSHMSQPHIYTVDEIAKIGNTLVYFAEHIGDLSKTKLLKMVYLLEETFIKHCARPFLNLDFEVWKFGPVAKDIYVDVNSAQPHIFKDYISTHPDQEGKIFISAKAKFDDDEFSDIEIEFLNKVVRQFGNLTAKELVEVTHRPHLPWTMNAQHYEVLEDLLMERVFTTDYKVDFNTQLDKDQQKIYQQHLEYLAASKSLK